MQDERKSKPKTERESRYFAIYPDYWKDKWGKKPLLGTLMAENEFHACRRAYDTGAVRLNLTFGPEAVEVTKAQADNLHKYRHRRYR